MTPLTLKFTGGMNNNDSPLNLFARDRGETQSLVNAKTDQRGLLKPLRKLTAVNATAESSSIHSVFNVYNSSRNLVLVGVGTSLKYVNGTSLTTLLTGLSGEKISFTHVGDWVYLTDGTNRKAVYLPTPVGTDWGQDPPNAAPTVADSGVAGNPDGTYSCYSRYKITLPDASILRTALSPVGTVTVVTNKIAWSALVHSTFEGATTREIELFRTKTGFSGTYLVTTLSEGTTTYTDDVTDAALQGNTEYDEDGYYPFPDSLSVVFYHPGANRIFAASGNDVYWSEPGLYHICIYDESADEYTNTNTVFPQEESITAIGLWDEQLYFGSTGSWLRLRGYNPDYWLWEPTSAIKGPLSQASLVNIPMGLLYPGNDGYLWLFSGIESKKIIDQFIFGTSPTSSSCGAFDGTYYYLFYGDTTYPELLVDLSPLPASPPKVIQSARTATSVHYDKYSNRLYIGGSDGYVRYSDDTDQDITMSFQTAEIPIDQIDKLGDAATLVLEVDTKEDNLVITQFEDGIEQTSLTPISTAIMQRVVIPISLNIYRTLSIKASITSKKAVRIREPWFLSQEDDG